MKVDLPKAYDASRVEDSIYKLWEESGYFNPDKLPGRRAKTFSLAMPPPNATGILHIGHAMFLTIQDLVARFQRMLGKKVLWLPGTDHAAIATQAKVERILKEEGKDKYSLGREKFLQRVNKFVKGSQATIHKQIRKMGSSCDWSRERYTLDEGLSQAVREAFARMYRDGLIYRGTRIVNWCPRCESTLADDEVEYRQKKTKFYYFRYGPVVIATARPETKFLDKTIIVHPKDKRYTSLHGKIFEVEWIEGKIQANLIADPIVDMNFGTGAMTITPAHSFEDFDLAKKYHLPVVQIIDEKGNFTQAAGAFAGKNARESRDAIVEILKKKDILEKIDDSYIHNLSVCYRCETPVEPLPKEQWFVDVNKKFSISNFQFPITKKRVSLKELAIHVVKSGQIKIIPERFEKVYFHWMENLRDWCISRQIWFGHRVPVYYCKPPHLTLSPRGRGDGGEGLCPPIVSVEEPEKCPNCGETTLEQDPDTLDTWFSSGLWTFSTLGWPKKTKDLARFHPTSLMETGYDIIFFWVARMILMSVYCMKEVPFREVYLHGLVRDEKGLKMSKSLGNTIDPLEVCAKYGTDAVRLSLLIGTAPGNDLNLGEEKIKGFRNFTNKLWNISRYIFLTVEKVKRVPKAPKPKTLFDEWILGRFHEVAAKVTNHLEKYEFSAAGELLREFSWNEFADWYIEISKIFNFQFPISNEGVPNTSAQDFKNLKLKIDSKFKIQNSSLKQGGDKVLLYILERLLILWHPFMPYVTEELWKYFSKEPLMIQKWPTLFHEANRPFLFPHFEGEKTTPPIPPFIRGGRRGGRGLPSIFTDVSKVQNLIIAIRNLKAENKLSGKTGVRAVIVCKKPDKILQDSQAVIEKLAGVKIAFSKTKPKKSVSAVVGKVEIHIAGSRDTEKIQQEISKKEAYIKSLEKKLNNSEFISKAPAQIVEKEKSKLAKQKEELKKIKENLLET